MRRLGTEGAVGRAEAMAATVRVVVADSLWRTFWWMLRCAGCDEMVSEWAARCPRCGRSTDDASVAVDAGAQITAPTDGPDRLGPVPLDSDSSDAEGLTTVGAAPGGQAGGGRRRWRGRRPVVALAAVGLVACAGVVVGLRVTAGPKRPPGVPALPKAVTALKGPVVGINPYGTVLVSDPDGHHPRLLVTLGVYGELAVAPDRRFLAAADGRLIVLSGGRLSRSDIPNRLPAGAGLAFPDPFADSNRALVVLGDSGAEANTSITLIPLGRRAPPLAIGRGDGEAVAGDPQTLGVYVSVPATTQLAHPPPGGGMGLVDARVEWRVAGQPTVTVATTGQVARDAGQAPATPVHLAVYPDPAGDKLAVVVDPPGGGGDNAAIVVLDRRGHLLGSVHAGPGGPTEYIAPAWSPNGRSLAYPTYSQYGPALTIWTVGHPVEVRDAPDPGLDFGSCLWAPNNSAVLCPAHRTQGSEWVFGNRTGPLYAVPNPAAPIAWLPAP